MKKKIIIVGRNSFIARHLQGYFKRKCIVNILSYQKFIKNSNLNNIDYVINCSSRIEYVKKKYQSKFDHDLQISKKIFKFKKCKLVFLSTRKIYKPNNNIKEGDKILPKENYSKNKYITEKKLLEILRERVLILRI